MDVIQLIIGSGGLIGVGYIIFKIGRLTQKVDSEFHYIGNKFLDMEKTIESRFSSMDKNIHSKFVDIEKKLDKVISDLDELKKDVTSLDMRVGKLEVRVEERTLRVVHVASDDKEMAVR